MTGRTPMKPGALPASRTHVPGAAGSSGEPGPRDGWFARLRLEGFGLFATLLLSTALGFAAFFLTTCIAIFSLLIYNESGHPTDMALAYRRFGFPVGMVVWIAALAVLGGLWARRKIRGTDKT
jgi:hypothetical protein